MKINYLHLSAEFVVIVIGVAVALAAESWRQDLLERSAETEYIERLNIDLQQDQENLKAFIEDSLELLASTNHLISVLESSARNLDRDEVISNLLVASSTPTFSVLTIQDIAYQELINTGGFNIIESSAVRQDITEYYRLATINKNAAERIPNSIFSRFRELTGYVPYYYTNLENSLTESDKTRLLEELDDKNILREFRAQRSSLDTIAARLSQLLSLNIETLQILDNYR